MKGTIVSVGLQKRAFLVLFAVKKSKDGLGTNSLVSGLPQCLATF